MAKMMAYESYKDWANAQSKGHQELIKVLRKLIQNSSKKLNEGIKWGNACWTLGDLPIVYIYSDKKQLQLGFFAGSMMKDPQNRFEGKSKFVRFIKIKEKSDIDMAYFPKLIKQAMKIKYK